VESFVELVRRRLPAVAKHMENIEFSLSELVSAWFENLFLSFLPPEFIVRLVDNYLNEGSKTLLYVGFAVLKMLEAQILSC
jgi:TBC1 domain family member 6